MHDGCHMLHASMQHPDRFAFFYFCENPDRFASCKPESLHILTPRTLARKEDEHKGCCTYMHEPELIRLKQVATWYKFSVGHRRHVDVCASSLASIGFVPRERVERSIERLMLILTEMHYVCVAATLSPVVFHRPSTGLSSTRVF